MTGRLRGVPRRLALLGAGLLIAAGAIAATASSAGRRGDTVFAMGPEWPPAGLVASTAPHTPLGLLANPGAAGKPAERVGTARPVRLAIDAIGVHTALQPLGLLSNGSLQSPARWDRAGWYADGVVPGQVGPAVIAGHVDSTSGPAVFFRLGELRAGDAVRITLHDGRRLTFVVDRVDRYPKSNFPTATVYAPTPDPELRLVTCTGRFDRAAGSYVDNLVVSAHLA